MLDYIQLETFTSVWFWIFLALTWSARSHWVLGVPFDAIVRADRNPDKWGEAVDTLARVHAQRYCHVVDNVPITLVTLSAFTVGALGTASVIFWIDIAQAAFVIALPMMIVTWEDIRLARRVLRDELEGSPLRRVIVWRRFVVQLWGIASISAAAGFLIFDVISRTGAEPIL
mgnify:CR=1 FL=1